MAESDKVDAKRCNTNHFILAALSGTLAVTIIVTVISFALRPTHVSFSVTDASRKVSSDSMAIDLTFTVNATNPSRRCKVSYQNVFVDLYRSSHTAGAASIHAEVHGKKFPPTGYDEGPGSTLINASVKLLVGANTPEASGFNTQQNKSGLSVVVMALVRFKIGVFRTRLFEMTVLCPGVIFSEEGSSSSVQLHNFNCSG